MPDLKKEIRKVLEDINYGVTMYISPYSGQDKLEFTPRINHIYFKEIIDKLYYKRCLTHCTKEMFNTLYLRDV